MGDAWEQSNPNVFGIVCNYILAPMFALKVMWCEVVEEWNRNWMHSLTTKKYHCWWFEYGVVSIWLAWFWSVVEVLHCLTLKGCIYRFWRLQFRGYWQPSKRAIWKFHVIELIFAHCEMLPVFTCTKVLLRIR